MKLAALASSAIALVCIACGGSAPAAAPAASPSPVELTSATTLTPQAGAPGQSAGQVTPPGEYEMSFTPTDAPKKAADPAPEQSLSPESPASKATKSEKLNPPPGAKKK
jgi:hypothetical protein